MPCRDAPSDGAPSLFIVRNPGIPFAPGKDLNHAAAEADTKVPLDGRCAPQVPVVAAQQTMP